MTTLVHPSLLVEVFVPLGGTDVAVAENRAHLARLWHAAGSRLGMTEPLLDGLPTELPTLPVTDEPTFRVIAGRSTDGLDGIAQAYLFARHDVLGLCVALGSSGEAEPWTCWSALSRRWQSAVDDQPAPGSLLGESRLFIAHVNHPAASLSALGGEVHGALRQAGYGAWDPGFVTSDGISLWSWQGPHERRITSLLSRPEQEDALSRWTWWQDAREAPRYLLYQLNAAKLDYETRVHRGRRQQMMAALDVVDRELDDVQELHASVALSGRASMPGLMDAQERLIASQAASSSVVIQTTYLRALRRTVSIARRNLAGLTPAAGGEQSGDADSVFLRDQAQGAWLEDQIDNDLGYAEAVLARAREAQALTLLRLQQLSTRIARAQSRVTLLQTSILGALGAALGYIAILRLSFDPPEAARLPLLLVFTSLLLAAPALAAHWFERYGLVDHLAAMLLGAAVGWLATALLANGSAPLIEILGAVFGALMGRALTWLHDSGPLPGLRSGASR